MKASNFFPIIIVMVTFLIFTPPTVSGKDITRDIKLHKYHYKPIENLTPAQILAERTRNARFDAEQLRMARLQKRNALYLQQHAIPRPTNGGPAFTGSSTTLNATSNSSGDFVLFGTLTNTGTSSAVWVSANTELFDGRMNSLGTARTYVYGGTNVQLPCGGFTTALYPGETGFYQIRTYVPATSVDSYSAVSFTYEDTSHTKANAGVQFSSGPNWNLAGNDLAVSGTVKNPSSSFMTYYNTAHFGILDDGGQLVAVDSVNVSGTSYTDPYGSPTTALSPLQSGTFGETFEGLPPETYSSALSNLSWYETPTTPVVDKNPPFGSFDTPLTGTTVASSIPVTGWALDDVGVDRVSIYAGQGGNLTYIDDAVLIEGARPDVAAAFPAYPDNSRAGWGYMMLTNFLPGGDGTFTFEAIAYDTSGRSTSLGTKTILVDNANAVKPFGAIDTPKQGETVYGISYLNWGWVLTPQPNTIPRDGSTINVIVDSRNAGNPSYNRYRGDIERFFPGYNNSDGAAGLFYMDTTGYADGVYTIQWTATDDGGSTDGIGSRFFTIANNERQGANRERSLRKKDTLNIDLETLRQLPEEISPVRVKHSLNKTAPLHTVNLSPDNTRGITVRQMQYTEIHIQKSGTPGSTFSGCILSGNRLLPLPTGSTLDKTEGVFYWMPAPGFLGRYPMAFIETTPDGCMIKTLVTIQVVPKFMPPLSPGITVFASGIPGL